LALRLCADAAAPDLDISMKKFPVTLVLAAVIAVGAWYVSQQKTPTTEIAQTLLYPAFLDQVNATHTLRVEASAGAINILREGEQWVVQEFGGYPARSELVRQTLLQLGNLRIVEAKTGKAENYPALEVEDRQTPNAKSRAVRALDKDGQPLLELLVGKTRPARAVNPPGHFVRRAGEASAYLVEGELTLGATAQDWIETQIVDLPVDRVRQVTITPKDGKPIIVNKANPEVQLYTLAEVPNGMEVKARATVSSMGGLLLDARLEKVRAARELEGQAPSATAEVETFDGLTVKLARYDLEDQVWVTLEFAHTPDRVVAPAPAPTPEKPIEEMNAGPAPTGLKKAEEVAEEARVLNARVKGWAYVLPTYKTRLLEKTLDDLLKKKS
jgi:hypothetical protein